VFSPKVWHSGLLPTGLDASDAHPAEIGRHDALIARAVCALDTQPVRLTISQVGRAGVPEVGMDFSLTEGQQMIRDTARRFAQNEIAPHVRENEHNERFPVEVMRKMAPIGLLGGPIAEQYGGAGVDSISYALICEEIGKESA